MAKVVRGVKKVVRVRMVFGGLGVSPVVVSGAVLFSDLYPIPCKIVERFIGCAMGD